MKAFFAFDRALDASRAEQLRGRWDGADRTSSGFCDDATWAALQMRGPEGIVAWVHSEMEGADAVVVLVGAETSFYGHVKAAIERGVDEGLGLVGVRIHQIPDAAGMRGVPGPDPLFGLHDRVTTHDWMPGFSDRFLTDWIYLAARQAGRL